MAKSIVSSFSFSKVVNEWRNIDVIIALKAINALHAVACWCLHDRCNEHIGLSRVTGVVTSPLGRWRQWHGLGAHSALPYRPVSIGRACGPYKRFVREKRWGRAWGDTGTMPAIIHHLTPLPPSLESSYRRDDWHLINTWVAGLFSFSVSLAVLWIISPSLSSCRIWFGWIILANETLVTKNPTIMEHRGTESLD